MIKQIIKIKSTLSVTAFLSIGLFLFVINSVQADALNVAFSDHKPPFVLNSEKSSNEYGHFKGKGLEVEIFTQALEHSNHSILSATYVPNNRLSIAISTMKIDAAVSVIAKDDGSFYSDELVEYKNYAISRTADQLNISSIADLKKYNTIAWQGANQHLGANFRRLLQLDRNHTSKLYTELVDQKIQSLLFWHKRAQVILVDKSIFLWNKKLFASTYNTNIELTYHNLFSSTEPFRVAFKSAALRNDFNLGLKYLRETGGYQKILDKYTH
jgi:polar amino acid transport system substrate-binding protein